MNLTFLIPVKIESEDRVRNLITVLSYLLTKVDAKIIVKECDTEQKFAKLVSPYLSKRFGVISHRVRHIYEEQKDNFFHKTRILNDLIEEADTEIVCNYDTDVLLPVTSYTLAYEMIKRGQCDAVYPYGCGVYQKAVTYNNDICNEFLESKLDVEQLDKYVSLSSSTIGWCQFIRKENYIHSYMMNENFQAWGPEDSELYYRLNALGNRVVRVNDYVYHLEHSRSADSWFNNPMWQQNTQLWNWIRTQSKENLSRYYESQDYVKRRLSSAKVRK